jgi:cell division protein FtsN
VATKRRGAQRTGGGASWARGFITGIASGGIAAAVLYFSVLNRQPAVKPSPDVTKAETAEAKTITGPKPKFEFYTILPELEVPVPDQPSGDVRQATVPRALQTPPPAAQGAPAPGAPPTPGATGAPQAALPPAEPLTPTPSAGGRYILQAGSSRNPADAERLRASLALQGMSAQVQPVSVNGETWHRIRVGPFASRADADAAQRQLHGARINTMLLELRNP